MNSFSRMDRVGQQVLEILSRLLIMDMDDPRVSEAQLTAVEVSPDLRHAKVYWVPLLQDADEVEIGKGLKSAAGFMRRALGQELETKYTPELVFVFDESVERGRRIDSILSEVEIPSDDEGQDEDED